VNSNGEGLVIKLRIAFFTFEAIMNAPHKIEAVAANAFSTGLGHVIPNANSVSSNVINFGLGPRIFAT
jgi:hypothetical protein